VTPEQAGATLARYLDQARDELTTALDSPASEAAAGMAHVAHAAGLLDFCVRTLIPEITAVLSEGAS
jgi:hypothetical protein